MTEIQKALETAPCSDRALGDRAGLSGELVRLIRLGKRNLTPAVAARLAAALEEIGGECLAAADVIRLHAKGEQ